MLAERPQVALDVLDVVAAVAVLPVHRVLHESCIFRGVGAGGMRRLERIEERLTRIEDRDSRS